MITFPLIICCARSMFFSISTAFEPSGPGRFESLRFRTRRRRFKGQPAGIYKAGTIKCRARKADCLACLLKSRCCPKTTTHTILRWIHEGAGDMAWEITRAGTSDSSRRGCKKVEMLFAHPKRIFRLGRLRLLGPCSASDEFILAAVAQNLRKPAKLRPKLESIGQIAQRTASQHQAKIAKSGISPTKSPRHYSLPAPATSKQTDFFIKIGTWFTAYTGDIGEFDG